MCGIVGYRGPRGSRSILETMTAAVSHRGPDSDGLVVRDSAGVAVRRLRVIDLATGDQPIVSRCTGSVIAYNGELYNYRELRADLVTRGHRFTTESDTEVVLHFYEEYGPARFSRLNGMFAFAILNPDGSLVLARDHLGVKPLYYAAVSETLLFASEPKALLSSGIVPMDVSPAGLRNYLTLGHAIGPETIYSAIKRIKPGHFAVVDAAGIQEHEYWSVASAGRRWDSTSAPPREEIESLLVDAVERNMIADVPVGVFLSGGLDSSLVTALAASRHRSIATFSVGFGRPDDEVDVAAAVARQYGTRHTTLILSPGDVANVLPDIARAYDEPFADYASVPTLLMSRRAKQDVTAVLTGEGGDEIFGGYRRYVAEHFYSIYRRVPAVLRRSVGGLELHRSRRLRRLGRSAEVLALDDTARRFAGWTELFSSDERAELLGTTRNAGADVYDAYRTTLARLPSANSSSELLMAFELATWLPDAYLEKVDKATMACGLEARVPLLDLRLVEMLAFAPRAWKVQGLRTKVLLRQIASKYLPETITERGKQGFTPPVDVWLRTVFAQRVAALGDGSSRLSRIVDVDAVREIVSQHRRGENRGGQVWALLMLDEWAESLARMRRPEARAAGVVVANAGTRSSPRTGKRVALFPRYDRLGASSRYRTFQFIPALRRAGIEVDVRPLLPTDYLKGLYRAGWTRRLPVDLVTRAYLRRLFDLLSLSRYSVVVVEKELLPRFPVLVDRAIAAHVKVIVDYDDPVYLDYGDSEEHLGRIGQVAASATAVHAGSRYLQEVFLKANVNTRYLPTTVRLDAYTKTRRHGNGSRLAVGWIGTPITAPYLKAAEDGLAMAAEATPLYVRAIGTSSTPLSRIPVSCERWSEATEAESLLELDVGIMPLPDNAWTRGKCGLKLLQYMACGLPVVASPVGANVSIVRHGETGYLATTPAEWADALRLLGNDAQLRQRMGEAGRARVEQYYSTEAWEAEYVHSVMSIAAL